VPPVQPVKPEPVPRVQIVYQAPVPPTPPEAPQNVPPAQYTYTIPGQAATPQPAQQEKLAQQALTFGILGLSLSMIGVPGIVFSSIAANKANIKLDFKEAAAIDLAGRNVLEAVQMSVNPKVITTPKVSAVALDGIQLHAITRITVRASIQKLVGGAGEETVIARVGEGIVSSIGSAVSHKEVLENPNMISKKVLASGLDAGTAFEILSIDIADVDVGQNIGAILETDRAEADKKIAQAKAEERRAMAFAAEQEMKAKVMEMKAKLVEAEAQIPMAMATALRDGKLGVMDYYNLKNIEADTQMRKEIGNAPEAK
ncbi:flotillin-like protein FloA, partial [Fibrobacter sp.]|uniref:flotillin-like protein FloA n=1 Tax=Fibrobacter sp. TaxID=35828 RepID=UPI0025C3FF9B